MAIYYPPIFINKYLQEKLAIKGFGAVPFYPTFPTDFSISENFIVDVEQSGKVSRYAFGGQAAVYDRLLRMRRSAFPHIKNEQTIYYFYALTEKAVINLIEMSQVAQDLLDNGDESAQDLNAWIATKVSGTKVIDGKEYKVAVFDDTEFLLPFFHDIKIYQLEEARDLSANKTARTYAGNKMIIEYNWHKS